jgi:hypothetical protein
MKLIKYKQVARITLYRFDDLYRYNDSSIFTDDLKSEYYTTNLNSANVQVGKNAKRLRFQIKGLDNVKLSENARLCMESISVPLLYDGNNNDFKSLGQTIVGMSNLSSLNCFDSQGNGQTDTVIFTGQTQITQQKIGTLAANGSVQNFSPSPVFYNPYPEMLYNFPISINFLNNIYIDLTITPHFTAGDFIQLVNDQEYFDIFHTSFIVYDLDEEELSLTRTQDVDFKKIGETLPRKINNIR